MGGGRFINTKGLAINKYFEEKESNNTEYKCKYEYGVYEGEMIDEKKKGFGQFVFLNSQQDNSEVYTGYWEDDKKNGKGIYYYINGDYYEGQWKDNMKEGKGLYYYRDSNAFYSGDWVRGKKNGEGVYVFFKDKMKTRQSTSKVEVGRYEGKFKDDVFVEGTYTFKNSGKNFVINVKSNRNGKFEITIGGK